MGMMVKGVPVPVLAGLAILIIGGIFHIIGLATPYWHTQSFTNTQVTNQDESHHGLFVSCSSVIDDIVDCQANEMKGFLRATQAMEFLALLCGIICMVVTGLWFFLELTSYQLIFMITSLLAGFLSGLFGIIGIIIYAAQVHNAEDSIRGTRIDRTLGWSFALCTLSSCLAVIAVICIAIGSRMVKK